jgi:D-glycero-D-manno-heptose 1,7-bisphosphate phosphatase
VFLDRDGTLSTSPPPGDYVTDPDQLTLLTGAGEAIARFNRAGIWVGVVTNQRGIALGLYTRADLEAIHRRLAELLAAHGAHLDGIWFCPHHNGECDCRKPQPGMLLAARSAVPGLDFARAAMIGDTEADVAAGNAAGVTTVRLGADIGSATFVASDLAAAAELLLHDH